MNPRTIQQVNDIGCCGCDYPECPPPRMECESITLEMCGLQVPEHPDMLEGECYVYFKVDFIDAREQSGYEATTYLGDPATYYLNQTETNTYTCETYIDEDGDCQLWTTKTRNDFDSTSYTVRDSDSLEVSRLVIDYDCSQENPIGGTGSCSGTYTSTATFWDEEEPTVTTGPCSEYQPCFVSDRVNAGCLTTFDSDSTMSVTDDFIEFEKVYPYEDAPETMPGQDTWTIKYWLLTIAAMLEMLAAKAFPTDVNGNACSAHLYLDGICDSPSSAQKFRYRFAPPEEYLAPGSLHQIWEMQWDEVFASREWWAWFDGGMIGVEPTPGPVALGDPKEWTWDPEGDEWSPWFSVNAPSEEGEIRVVNILSECWKNVRIGSKPTAYGDQIAL